MALTKTERRRDEEAAAPAALVEIEGEDRPLVEPASRNGKAHPKKIDRNALAKLIYFHHKLYDSSFTWKDAIVLTTSLIDALATLYLYIPYIHEAAHGRTGLEVYWQISGSSLNVGLGLLAALTTLNSFREPLPYHVRQAIGDPNSLIRKIAKGIVLLPASALAAFPMANATIGALHRKLIVGVSQTVMNYFSLERVVVGTQLRWLLDTFTCDKRHREFLLVVTAHEHTMNQFVDGILSSNERVPAKFRAPKDERTFTKRFLEKDLDNFEDSATYSEAPGYLQAVATKIREQKLKPYQDLSFLAWMSRRLLPGTLGSLLITGGLIGYVAKTYQNIGETMHTSDSNRLAATGALNLPFLDLAAFAGSQVGISLASAVLGEGRLPLAMRLRFWSTLGMMLVVAGLATGSTVTATQLIDSSPYFQKGGALSNGRDLFHYWALVSAGGFNALFNWGLGFTAIEHQALNSSDYEIRSRARLAITTRDYLNDVRYRMDPKVLAACLLAMDEGDREALVNLLSADDQLADLLEHILDPNYNAQIRAETFSRITGDTRTNRAAGYAKAARGGEGEVAAYRDKSGADKDQYVRDDDDDDDNAQASSWLPSLPPINCSPVTDFFASCGKSRVFHPTTWPSMGACWRRVTGRPAVNLDGDGPYERIEDADASLSVKR